MLIYNWDEWAEQQYSITSCIGHEFYGEIVEVGDEVKSFFKIGDRVSGEKSYCLRTLPQLPCRTRAYLHGKY